MRRTCAVGLVLVLGGVAFTASVSPAHPQARPVTIDFSTVGTGAIARDAFNQQGVVFGREGHVNLVAGDEAIHGSAGDAAAGITGAFNGSADTLALRVAPAIPTGFSAVITAEMTMTARDESGAAVASDAAVITVSPDQDIGTGYVTLAVGDLPRPATQFEVSARIIRTNIDFCHCFWFGISELTFTLDEPATDSFAPVVTVPPTLRLNATSRAGTRASYTARVTDNRDTRVSADCAPRSGSRFPIGTTTVRCTARDSSGNVSPPQDFAVEIVVVGPRPPRRAEDHVVGFGSVLGAQRFQVFAEAGAVSGRAHGTLSGSGAYTFEGRATCLVVEGNRATVGGVVGIGSERLGRGVLVSYEDNGDSGTRDRIIGFAFSPSPPRSCPAPLEGSGGFTIDGDIDVHDARAPSR